MEDKNFKQQKAKFNFVIIYILGFVISAFFEFYWISYYPYDYFMLAGIGIILCILGYLSIDGILNIIHSAEQKRDEQAETLIKAGKAIYLTTKRMALEQSHTLPEVSDVPKDLNSLVNDLAKANERLSKEVEHAISIQPLLQENQKLVNSVQNTLNTESSAATEEPVVEDIPVDPEPAMAEDSPVVDDIPEVAVDAPAMEEPVVEEPVVEPVKSELPFTDVTPEDWFYTAVEYLYNEGIMNGTSETEFSPEYELNRATVVTILYRLEGEPEVETAGTFSDVEEGEWYTAAVEWAASVGIVKGYEDGTFAPKKAVTREQLAAIIYRYAEFKGITIAETTAELGEEAVVSDWAKANVEWAVSEGLLVEGENVNATENANRAEVAAMIYTFLTKTSVG